MKFCVTSSISRVLATTLLMFLLLGILEGLYSYNTIQNNHIKQIEEITYVRELEWQLIESTIYDNYSIAGEFSSTIKQQVVSNILDSYSSKTELQRDLKNPNTKVYHILADAIKGKYLNGIENDNNSLYVATENGIIVDLNLNNNKDNSNTIRTWDKEIDMGANQGLAENAINAILVQNDGPIFDEPMASLDITHTIITNMNLEELHKIFLKEGINGLQTYEFLKPLYIKKYSDIFDIPDRSNLGIRQDSDKFIIISKFNVYDILMKYHKASLAKYDTTIELLTTNYNNENNQCTLISLFFSIVVIFCIIITAVVNNYLVSLIQKEEKSEDAII